ncbi:hypothetical protein CAI22_16210 [Acinetobacter johnsonii]|nr:single-stranded DNA-binding protein [Acinetobacter johnsonii]NKG39221.1 hypothetical protein [Acinetobacter johnsonii]
MVVSLFKIVRQVPKKRGKVYNEGSLRTRKWKDQSGIDREVIEIRADVLQFLIISKKVSYSYQ